VTNAPFLFAGRRAIASVNLACILRTNGDHAKASHLFKVAAQEPEAFAETRVDAMIGQALLLEDSGDTLAASEMWRGVLGNPDANQRHLKLAWEHLGPDVS
jgi:hypothetical protein